MSKAPDLQLAAGRPPAQPFSRANAAPERPLASVQGVGRRYGKRAALDGVTLDVRAGETLGLLGANGAGKTTLIHLLAGIASPDEGHIALLDGLDPRSPEARRRIGVAFQAAAVYPELEVEENVRFFARLYGLKGQDLVAAVEQALERVGLTERRTSRANTLSGGMLRRLSLACAIAHEPELLLLDEPTAALDPKSRAQLLEGLERIAHSGTTVVISTHHFDEAERLCDRVAILDAGRLIALGTPQELARAHGVGLVEAELERPESDAGRPARNLRLRWVGDQPFEDALRLLKSGARVRRLRVEGSSLETVFFSLTGRRLGDQ